MDLDDAMRKMQASAQRLGLDTGDAPKGRPDPDDASMYTLELPSRLAFYPVQDVRTRNLKFRELIPMGAAMATNDRRSIADAIGRTIYGYPLADMTFGDYQYVMYFHRLHLKRPWILRWECAAEEHVKGIGTRYEEGSLANSEHVQESVIRTRALDTDALEASEHMSFCRDAGLHVTAPTVDSVLTAFEDADRDDVDARARQQVTYLNKLAVLLDKRHGATLADRRGFLAEFFDEYSGDHFELMEHLVKLEPLLRHGVEDTISVKCAECGAETELEIPFLPLSFLPALD